MQAWLGGWAETAAMRAPKAQQPPWAMGNVRSARHASAAPAMGLTVISFPGMALMPPTVPPTGAWKR